MKLLGSCLLGFQQSLRAGCRQGEEGKNGLGVAKQVKRVLLEACGEEDGW